MPPVRLPNVDAFRQRLETALPAAIYYLNSPDKAGTLFERGDNELPDHAEAQDLVLKAYSQVMADTAQRGTDFHIPNLTEEAVWILIRGGHPQPEVLGAAIDHVQRHGPRQMSSVYATAIRDAEFVATSKANSSLWRHVSSLRDWGKGVLKLMGFTSDSISQAGRHAMMGDPTLTPWHDGNKDLRRGLLNAVNDVAITHAPPSPDVIELVNRRDQMMAEFRMAERNHIKTIATIDELVANAGFAEYQRQNGVAREAPNDRAKLMSLHAQPGDKIRFTGVNGRDGDQGDAASARLYLGVDAVYTVARVNVGNWDSTVELAELPGQKFNTVMFNEVPVAQNSRTSPEGNGPINGRVERAVDVTRPHTPESWMEP